MTFRKTAPANSLEVRAVPDRSPRNPDTQSLMTVVHRWSQSTSFWPAPPRPGSCWRSRRQSRSYPSSAAARRTNERQPGTVTTVIGAEQAGRTWQTTFRARTKGFQRCGRLAGQALWVYLDLLAGWPLYPRPTFHIPRGSSSVVEHHVANVVVA